jgi:mono/diheme cytochrome c family protein
LGESAVLIGRSRALEMAARLGLNRDFSRRVFEFDAGMTFPVSAQAYDPSAVLRRGQVLQLPPKGTVARGQAPALAFKASKEEADRAARELVNPIASTPANRARGEVIWNRVCAACHGDGAKGDGGVIPRFPNPPNLVIPKFEAYEVGRIFHVATFGGPEKIMKPLGDHLSAEDRWKAAMHLRFLMDEAVKARAAKAAAPAVPGISAPAVPGVGAPATPVPTVPGAKP